MRRFIAGLIVGSLLVGGSAFASTQLSGRTVHATHGDVIRIGLTRTVTCVVGSTQAQAFVCQRKDGRGYLVYLDAGGSAAIRRNNRSEMTCLWPEAYCVSK